MTAEGKNRIIKKYAGGICSMCDVPTRIATYDVRGAQVVERYCCEECFKKWERFERKT